MSETPKNSPWGKVQFCEELYPGVYDVSTAGHGGIMVKNNIVDSVLSPTAQKCGFKEKGYLNFEEDCQANVVERELIDKGLWEGSPRFESKADYEELIDNSLKQWNPEYWQAREKTINEATTAHGSTDQPGKTSILAQLEEKSKEVKPSAAVKKDDLEH